MEFLSDKQENYFDKFNRICKVYGGSILLIL
jgi:hypothetical protein